MHLLDYRSQSGHFIQAKRPQRIWGKNKAFSEPFLKPGLDLVKEVCKKCCYAVSGSNISTSFNGLNLQEENKHGGKTQEKRERDKCRKNRPAVLCSFAPCSAHGGCDESLTTLDAPEKLGTSLVSSKTTTLNHSFYSVFMQRIIVKLPHMWLCKNLAFKSKL